MKAEDLPMVRCEKCGQKARSAAALNDQSPDGIGCIVQYCTGKMYVIPDDETWRDVF